MSRKTVTTAPLQFPVSESGAESSEVEDYRTSPFCDCPIKLPKAVEARSKTATKSRINQLTVGDVRFIFTQLRGCRHLDPNYTLWTGCSAGKFSLDYLLQSSSMAGGEARKAKLKNCNASVEGDEEEEDEEGDDDCDSVDDDSDMDSDDDLSSVVRQQGEDDDEDHD